MGALVRRNYYLSWLHEVLEPVVFVCCGVFRDAEAGGELLALDLFLCGPLGADALLGVVDAEILEFLLIWSAVLGFSMASVEDEIEWSRG